MIVNSNCKIWGKNWQDRPLTKYYATNEGVPLLVYIVYILFTYS